MVRSTNLIAGKLAIIVALHTRCCLCGSLLSLVLVPNAVPITTESDWTGLANVASRVCPEAARALSAKGMCTSHWFGVSIYRWNRNTVRWPSA